MMFKFQFIQLLKTIYRRLTRFINFIDVKIIPLFALNGFFASIYYTFFNTSFYREHLSVLRGRDRYFKSLNDTSVSNVLLRRNIHRLEKGLIMQPRRSEFAKSYILETVDCYLRCLQTQESDQQELVWAKDVLSEYFAVVSTSEAEICEANQRFLKSTNHASTSKNNAEQTTPSITWSKPYPHEALPPSSVDYTSLFTLFKRRRSVRWYQDRVVPTELIVQAVRAASLAHSACNRQPYRFNLFNDSDEASKVAKFAMGTAGFSDQLPCLVAVIGDLGCYPKERDRHVIYIDAALASMQFMLSLETLGLSSCPINWPDIESREKKMQSYLGLPSHERVVMLIAVGYAQPQGGVPYSQKKSPKYLLKSSSAETASCQSMV